MPGPSGLGPQVKRTLVNQHLSSHLAAFPCVSTAFQCLKPFSPTVLLCAPIERFSNAPGRFSGAAARHGTKRKHVASAESNYADIIRIEREFQVSTKPKRGHAGRLDRVGRLFGEHAADAASSIGALVLVVVVLGDLGDLGDLVVCWCSW